MKLLFIKKNYLQVVKPVSIIKSLHNCLVKGNVSLWKYRIQIWKSSFFKKDSQKIDAVIYFKGSVNTVQVPFQGQNDTPSYWPWIPNVSLSSSILKTLTWLPILDKISKQPYTSLTPVHLIGQRWLIDCCLT